MVFKVYRFQKRAFLLTVHKLNWRRRKCRIGKTKTMMFSAENLVLVKVLPFIKKKVMTIDEWSHCFIGDNCERAWVIENT